MVADAAHDRGERIVGHQRLPGALVWPSSASYNQPWMFSPAGQASLHGGREFR